MGINFNPTIGINHINFRADKTKSAPRQLQTPPDTFVRESKEVYYAKRLEELFPNGELNELYDQMCNELELDYKPILNLVVPMNGNAGGGYTFFNNTVTLSLEDTIGSNTKLYGIKDGKEKFEMDEMGIPVMTSKVLASYVTNHPQAAKNKGYDKIIAKPASDEEIKKLFILKLRHELIHAKQHMVMRQTEGIGEKEIIAAWWKDLPDKGKPTENKAINKIHQKSYWANKQTPTKYTRDSERGAYAYKCLDAVRNYAPVESDEYKENFLEKEAFQESSRYIIERYGEWT